MRLIFIVLLVFSFAVSFDTFDLFEGTFNGINQHAVTYHLTENPEWKLEFEKVWPICLKFDLSLQERIEEVVELKLSKLKAIAIPRNLDRIISLSTAYCNIVDDLSKELEMIEMDGKTLTRRIVGLICDPNFYNADDETKKALLHEILGF